MSNYNQTHAQGASTAPAVEQPYMVPPPAGYPMKHDGQQGYPPPNTVSPPTTHSRGDGFWKGCCAALCCCCLLDSCF